MGTKRKAAQSATGANVDPVAKRAKPTKESKPKSKFIFEARPDWHTFQLPAVDVQPVSKTPPQYTIDALHKYAQSLLAEENATYNDSHKAGSSSHKFLSTIMSSGTLEDKVSALTLLVQESPLHATKAFESLLGLARKKSRNQALMALAALKDLLGQGVVLPGDRKLRAFGKQPLLLGALQGKSWTWKEGEPLPNGLQKVHLLVWAYEDWLKKMFFEMLQLLEQWCGDEVEYARSRALTYVFELLKDKPEQEENLLRLLVNKLGDTDRKIASRASYLLLQLETTHPAIKMIVTNSIEADCLFRPGQSLHAKYYAIVTLNQTIFSQKEEKVANRLLEIYFGLFVQLLKTPEEKKTQQQANGRVQHGGGKAGKLAAKKRKAQERKEDADVQLGDRMVAQVLTGVNRAFPYADTSDPTFERQMDTLFRVTHNANFNTAVQALMLIQQISTSKHYNAERFYRTLYESLLDPRLISSSKQVMYLNLLYKALKADLNAKRVQAFAKRLLQVLSMHEPPFVCGVLYLVSELEGTFPSIRSMLTEPEIADEDEEEHFRDVPEDGESGAHAGQPAVLPGKITGYDARKRNPEHAHADRSCLWDLLPFLQHFHPSVSLFAKSLLLKEAMPPKPDPTQHTLMHFLDRFVYRNARTKASASMHGSSIMQPTAGSEAADLLVKPGQQHATVDLNSEAFWTKKVEDVAAEDVFFHQYHNSASNKKRKGAEKKDRKEKARDEDASGSDSEGEAEIWKAITKSRPEVEGGDDEDEDDMSLGELEDAYGEDDDDGSEGGIDLGGEGAEEDEGHALPLDEGSDMEMDAMPDLDDEDDEAIWDDEDEVPEEVDLDEPKDLSESQKKRKERKKLKALPTFASAEDYAKLLGRQDESEEEDYMR